MGNIASRPEVFFLQALFVATLMSVLIHVRHRQHVSRIHSPMLHCILYR